VQGPVRWIQGRVCVEYGEGSDVCCEISLVGCAVELCEWVVVCWSPWALVLIADDPHDHHLGGEGISLAPPDCAASGLAQTDTGHGIEIEAQEWWQSGSRCSDDTHQRSGSYSDSDDLVDAEAPIIVFVNRVGSYYRFGPKTIISPSTRKAATPQ